MKEIVEGKRNECPVKIWSVGESLKIRINDERTFVFTGNELDTLRIELNIIKEYLKTDHPIMYCDAEGNWKELPKGESGKVL